MAINLHLPGKSDTLRPTITVIGVGGAGGNAVNNMIAANLEGVNFVVANTDAQALENSLTERRIQLGATVTRGLGAGANPETGKAAAEEAIDEIAGYIEGSNMIFITAGMGGGTGTGAAPVIAKFAKERGILTVGVVTKPFQFEGNHRMRLAEEGARNLQQFVDTLIVIPNQNLFRIANEKTTFADAFRMADEVLHSGVRGVTDLMIMPGLINLDFADIRTVMGEMGKAMMGTGEGEGPKRAVDAAEAAISNPLLDDVSMKGAKGVLINITGSSDMTLFEADEAASRIREEVDPNANIIFGATFNQSLEGKIRVSVVATGIDSGATAAEPQLKAQVKIPEPNRFYGGKLGFVAPPRPPESLKFPAAAAPKAPEPVLPEPVKAPPQPAMEHKPAVKEASGGLRSSGPVFSSPAPQPQPKVAAPPVHDPDGDTLVAFVSNLVTAIGALKYQEEAQQMPLPMAAGMRAPSFISPQAAQPAQRSFFAATDDVEFNGKSGARGARAMQTHESGVAREKDTSGAMNFLHRMANVGRVLTAKPEKPERTVHVVEKIRESLPAAQGGSGDDYLEIPAFLRRQAN